MIHHGPMLMIDLPHEAIPVSKLESGAAPERESYRRLRSAHPARHVGSETPNVRFGSKADIGASLRDVRFTPKSGHATTSTKRMLRFRKRLWGSVPQLGLCRPEPNSLMHHHGNNARRVDTAAETIDAYPAFQSGKTSSILVGITIILVCNSIALFPSHISPAMSFTSLHGFCNDSAVSKIGALPATADMRLVVRTGR